MIIINNTQVRSFNVVTNNIDNKIIQLVNMQTVYILDQSGKATELTEKKNLWPEKVSQCMHESDHWILDYDFIEQMALITVFTFSPHPNSNKVESNHPLLYSTFMALPGLERHFHLESYTDTTTASQGHSKWLFQLQAEDFTLSNLSLISD